MDAYKQLLEQLRMYPHLSTLTGLTVLLVYCTGSYIGSGYQSGAPLTRIFDNYCAECQQCIHCAHHRVGYQQSANGDE